MNYYKVNPCVNATLSLGETSLSPSEETGHTRTLEGLRVPSVTPALSLRIAALLTLFRSFL